MVILAPCTCARARAQFASTAVGSLHGPAAWYIKSLSGFLHPRCTIIPRIFIFNNHNIPHPHIALLAVSHAPRRSPLVHVYSLLGPLVSGVAHHTQPLATRHSIHHRSPPLPAHRPSPLVRLPSYAYASVPFDPPSHAVSTTSQTCTLPTLRSVLRYANTQAYLGRRTRRAAASSAPRHSAVSPPPAPARRSLIDFPRSGNGRIPLPMHMHMRFVLWNVYPPGSSPAPPHACTHALRDPSHYIVCIYSVLVLSASVVHIFALANGIPSSRSPAACLSHPFPRKYVFRAPMQYVSARVP